MKNAINSYYNTYWGSWITVTLEYLDDDGTVYDSSSDANVTTYKYTVKCEKLIDGYSANSITVSKVDTSANIVVTPPQNYRMSTAPLSGKYTITCTDPDGTEWTSGDIRYDWHQIWIANQLSRSIPFMSNRIEVINESDYYYRQNGVTMKIIMKGLDYGPAPCSIQSSTDDPILNDVVYS